MSAFLYSVLHLERSARFYLVAMMLIGFGHGGVTSVLFNLYLASLGYDTVFIGSLLGFGRLVWATSALPAAYLGAWLGLRGISAAGFGMTALGLSLYLLSPLLPPVARETWLFGSAAFAWTGAGLFTVNGVPYLMGVTPEAQRKTAFTLVGAGSALGTFLGSLTAGFLPGALARAGPGALSESISYNLSLWLGVLCYLGAMTMMLMARPVPQPVEQRTAAAHEKAPVTLLVFLAVLVSLQLFSEGSLLTFMNLYFAQQLGLSTGLIGAVFAIGKPLTILASPLLLLVMKRLGAGWTMTGGYVATAISAALLAGIPYAAPAVAIAIWMSPVASWSDTARSLFGQEVVRPRWRTLVSAVTNLSIAAGAGSAAVLGGRIISGSGYSGLFTLGAAAALAAAGLFAVYQRRAARISVKRASTQVG